MARQSSSLDSPRLARRRSDVAEQLTKRIKAGKEIQNRVMTADDFGAYMAAATRWTEYNSELLKVLFTNETIAYEYRSSVQEFIVLRDDRLNFRNWQVKIARQITKLESILERLDLYPEPTSKPEATETALADEPTIPDGALTETGEAREMTISNTAKSEIHSDIAQIEAETERPNPRRRFVKVFLESLRDNLAKAAAVGLVGIITTILAKFFGVL